MAACAIAAGCTPSAQQPPAPVKLTPVAALPKPSLPPWIASISPTQTAQTLAQIRVIFKKPVTKVEALSGDGPSDVLSHLTIEPALRGHFTVLTPRMIGFVAEQALPIGARVKVTLTAGLRDLDGDSLANDLAWTFETSPVTFTSLPTVNVGKDEETPEPVGTLPALEVTSNAAVDPDSLAAHATLTGNGDVVPMTAKLETQPTPYPGNDAAELFDPSLNAWVYKLTPQRELHLATTYNLKLEPGIDPAYGNLPTKESFDGSVSVYGPLSIVPTPKPSPGGDVTRFDNGDPVIVFSNPLDPKSIKDGVTVSPSVPSLGVPLAIVPDYANDSIAIDPYSLDPNATYTVTIAPTVKDVFGQTLGSAQTVTVTTGNYAPGAWAPTGTNVIPAGLPVDVNFYATNLPGNKYSSSFGRVPVLSMLGAADPLQVLPDSSSWPSKTLNAQNNKQSVVRVDVRRQLGNPPFGALAYGFRTGLDASNAQPGLVGIAQLTNLGVHAQWFPSHAIVMAQHLSDGTPVSNATVTVFRNVNDASKTPQQCAQGRTDAQGKADFSGVDVERCYAGDSDSDSAPTVGVEVAEGGDVATLITQSYDGISRFNVFSGWNSGAPLSRGTVFTDRSLYQPGEKGAITGIAYYVSGDRIVADRNAVYKVTLEDPSNATTSLGSVTTDAYGVFTLPLQLSKQQPLGYYSLDAKGASGNDVGGNFRVAEFKPPNFKMTLTLSADSATAGSSITANAVGAYLFGAPLQGGSGHAYATRDVAYVQPKGWDDYVFGRQWFYSEQTPSFDTDVLQKDVTFDADGKASLDVPVPADLPFPMTYTVDMEAFDVSNLSVSDSQTFLALPSDAVIGLTSDVVGEAGKAMPIKAIVTDSGGKAVSGRGVHFELQKMTYTSATQEVEGGDSAQQSIKYDTVATADATSSDQPVTVNLTPTDSGSYRVLANFSDAKSDASSTDMQVFAFGPGEADWGQSDKSNVEVKLDKKKYGVGDTAKALIANPFPNADIYVSVVRGDVLYHTVLHNVNGAASVPIKIESDMLPNAAVQAVVVRRGPPLASVKPGSLDTLERVGMAAFDVSVADRYLKIAIAPANATVTPASQQRVNFTLTSKSGAPVKGEIVAMVVNDAILQLSGYRLPDLVQTVFASQPISTVFSDNRDGIVLKTQTAPMEKGFGYGGGYMAGAAPTRVRANFVPMPFYGTVKTDASGKASVDFKMPDDLTTWRVMAVAVGGDDAHFATGDSTFISSQPLITNPLLPQFARTGDAFDAGVSIANQTGVTGALALVLQLTGALAFTSDNAQTHSANEQAAAGMQGFRYTVAVGTPAPSTFTVSSKLGSFSDAFTVPFIVSNQNSTDSVVESGATAKGSANVPIGLNSGGYLTLTLANSIVPQFAVPSNKWMNVDALPLADEAASRLVTASALQSLRAPYKLKLEFDPAAAIATALHTILSLQSGDGGFKEYSAAKVSDPFASAYVYNALIFARSHGVSVDDGAISRAHDFLATTLANPGRFAWCNDDPCKTELRFEALEALAAGGDRRTDFLSDVVAASKDFDSAGQIRVARYLLQTPGWQAQGATMADRLQQTLYVTGRYATANVSTPWFWMGNLVDAQSQMLRLLIERNAPPEQLDGAVRALVSQQCKCGWQTMDDNATALTALAAYAATEHLGPATATVKVGGVTVASAQFGATASSQNFTLQASSLHGDAVAITSTGGTVHYTVLYTYPIAQNAPGQLAAFRVIRTVAEPGPSSSPAATMDVAPIAPVTLPASHVYDVGVRVIVDHPVDRLVIEDPLPAGFEAVDVTFRTTNAAVVAQSDSWNIDSQQIYRDKVLAYASHLGPGVYDIHYLVRSVTPGKFIWPGARAYLKDAPEQFGRTSATTLTVSSQ